MSSFAYQVLDIYRCRCADGFRLSSNANAERTKVGRVGGNFGLRGVDVEPAAHHMINRMMSL